MVDRYYNHVSQTLLVTTTRALRKFVVEHEGVQAPVLDKLLALLEADDFRSASKLFRTIHFGAYGFGDWFPPVKFSNEDAQYAQVVFESLVERWHRLMQTAADDGK
jgi:hypothetical protein